MMKMKVKKNRSRASISETENLITTLGHILTYPRIFGLQPMKYDHNLEKFIIIRTGFYKRLYYPFILCAMCHPVLSGINLLRSMSKEAEGQLFKDPATVLHFFFYLPIAIYSVANLVRLSLQAEELVSLLNTFIHFYKKFKDFASLL